MESTAKRGRRPASGGREGEGGKDVHMQERTHSRFAEMSIVLPHPTCLVVMTNVRDMRIGLRVRAIGLVG